MSSLEEEGKQQEEYVEDLGKIDLSEYEKDKLPGKFLVVCKLGNVAVSVDHDWITLNLVDSDGKILENTGVYLNNCFDGY